MGCFDAEDQLSARQKVMDTLVSEPDLMARYKALVSVLRNEPKL